MKFFISSFTVAVLALSANVFAEEDLMKTEIMRTSLCQGSVDVNGSDVAVSAKIEDIKVVHIFDDWEDVEYWSTLTITNVENPAVGFLGNLVSTETSEDILEARTTENGPAFYNLFKSEAAMDEGDLSRSGLIQIACDITPDGKCPKVKKNSKKTQHMFAFLYPGKDENGKDHYDLTKEGGRQYIGKMTCTVQ